MEGRSRRAVLAAGAGVLASLAGCGGDRSASGTDTFALETTAGDGSSPGGNGSGDETDGGGDGAGDGGGTPTDSPGTSTAELDLREANVVGVEFESGDGSYRFSVTLYHDDDGEDGYANWWQVESLDGTRLGRRELVHAHSTAPFTRSETVAVPDDATCVVVRGHDQTHGYGGRTVLADLDSGATRAIDQGTEKRAFSPSDCP